MFLDDNAERSAQLIMEKRFNRFSVPLGLLDYVNPVFYTITMIIIITNTYAAMDKPYGLLLLAGAIISIFFGLIIPTVKVLVGLGIITFSMPVGMVFCVNTGILISGLMLFKYVIQPDVKALIGLTLLTIAFLIVFYAGRRKINTIAVLTGAIGYLLIYISLIALSVQKGSALPIVLYALSVMMFGTLCGVGIRADLKDPKIHWILEISNGTCQMIVAIATAVLFLG